MYKLLKSFVYKGFSLICYTNRLCWLLSDTEMGKDMPQDIVSMDSTCD